MHCCNVTNYVQWSYPCLSFLGPIGVAAAAAIQTAKKRKRPHTFETNPSIRKRQQTRLLRCVSTSYSFYYLNFYIAKHAFIAQFGW